MFINIPTMPMILSFNYAQIGGFFIAKKNPEGLIIKQQRYV